MTPELHATAILLRTYNLSETSVIACWLTQEAGIIKTTIKGAKSAKSKFSGLLELYSHSEIIYHTARNGGELHPLVDLHILTTHPSFRKSYNTLLVASYFGSLAEYWLGAEQPAEDVFDLLKRALSYCNTKEIEWKAVLHFEKELSKILGYSAQQAEARKLYTDSHKLGSLRARVQDLYYYTS